MKKNAKIFQLIFLLNLFSHHFGGININEALKPDPLIIHYREENLRLENLNDELRDQVKNLTETLAERDYSDDPCDSVKFIREKIKEVREKSAVEKKELLFPKRIFSHIFIIIFFSY